MAVESLYQRLPYPARVAVASLRGRQLDRRRYGPDLERQVAEALDRERWEPSRWAAWQRDRLSALLADAREHVPAYRDLPGAAGSGDVAALLAGLPILSKARVRTDPASLVRRDAPRRLITEHTSGTSGTPLTLVVAPDEYRSWYALAEARWRRWYGVRRGDRWAIVGGQPVAAVGATRPPYWVWNAAMHQLYLSSYHVGAETAPDYVRALEEHRVTYVLGYPSSLHALAEACRSRGVRPRGLRVVVGNAEPVLAHQRAAIEEVFGCPVRETYGMAEYVTAASECEAGRLHLWPEVGVLEVLEHGRDVVVAPGASGRFVATGLLNRTMPLVRYEVGDAGAVAAGTGPCPCGRTLPVLAAVDGRCDDLVRTPDGRLVGRLDPVFKADLPIAGAQIVQEELARFRILVVPAAGFDPSVAESIAERLRQRVGDVAVEVREVDELPLGPNGKFKAVVSHVTGDG